jgi:hypothetical protein
MSDFGWAAEQRSHSASACADRRRSTALGVRLAHLAAEAAAAIKANQTWKSEQGCEGRERYPGLTVGEET